MTDFQPGDLVEVISEPMVHGEENGLDVLALGRGGDVTPVIGSRFTVSHPVDTEGDVWLWAGGNESIPMAPECLRMVQSLEYSLTENDAYRLVEELLRHEHWRVRVAVFEGLAGARIRNDQCKAQWLT